MKIGGEKVRNIKLSNKIFDLGLSAKELSIYAYLCSLPSDYPMFDGTAVKVKQTTIAQKCGIKAVQTVAKVISTLATKGLVMPIKRSVKANGYKGTYTYEIKKLPTNDSFFFVDRKLKFRNSYHNMIQTMIAGRLEINGARYNVQPDRAALEFCTSNEQKLMLLTSASSAARKALTSVEYAFDTLRTENNLRKEEQNNAIRTVENSQRRAENASSRNGISSDTEKTVGEWTDRVSSGEEGRTAGLDNSSESRRSGETAMDSGDNDKNNNIGRSDDTAAVYAEPIERTVYPDDTERTVNDGRTGRTVRQNVDGEHGEELPGEGRANDVSSQLPDGSSFSGQESGG